MTIYRSLSIGRCRITISIKSNTTYNIVEIIRIRALHGDGRKVTKLCLDINILQYIGQYCSVDDLTVTRLLMTV